MVDLNLIKKHKLKPPFFIYDVSLIKKQFLKLKSSLPKNFSIFYSVKANPNINILKIFKKLGTGVEISSGGELSLVLKAGFLPKEIIFTGPGKTEEDLKYALTKRIRLIIVESGNEIDKIERIARGLNIKQDLLIRINPSFSMRDNSLVAMTGGRQKFGIDEEQIFQIISRFKKFKNVNLLGIHSFPASNIFDEELIIRNTEYLFKMVRTIESKFKIRFPVIDIGGGMAVNYSTKSDKLFNIKILHRGLETLINKYKFKTRKILLESGRFLIGEAGEYITRVVDRKESCGEIFIIINGGKNHLSMATLLKENHRVEVLNRKRSTPKEIINLVGNLNTPTDYITKTSLSKTKIGDWISIKKVGAYGLSAGMGLFSSHPWPGEYLLLEKRKLKDI